MSNVYPLDATAEPEAEKDAPLRDDIRLLGRLLGDTVREQEGAETFELVERIRKASTRLHRESEAGARRELSAILDSLDNDQTLSIVRAFSYFSHLANIAEDQHHIRRNHAHVVKRSAPRPGSLRHALNLIGLRPLRQWAMMMGMLSLADDKPHELSLTALSRARFAEGIAPDSGLKEHGGELFLGGMLSLVDTMVGRPLAELLDGLAVPERVRAALTTGENPLGPALKLVTAYQAGDWNTVDAAREVCPVDDQALNRAYVDSLSWAETTATG